MLQACSNYYHEDTQHREVCLPPDEPEPVRNENISAGDLCNSRVPGQFDKFVAYSTMTNIGWDTILSYYELVRSQIFQIVNIPWRTNNCFPNPSVMLHSLHALELMKYTKKSWKLPSYCIRWHAYQISSTLCIF